MTVWPHAKQSNIQSTVYTLIRALTELDNREQQHEEPHRAHQWKLPQLLQDHEVQ